MELCEKLDSRAITMTELPTLIDSGATTILRRASNEDEWRNAQEVSVPLTGNVKKVMRQTANETVVAATTDSIQPIVPVAKCKVA